ncbi:hypothetical protein EVAR_15802_1 [Eumeta japonica]|uniref:Uncharacterized protein n=1 Tax=Eumeta variegata TaxID=151549 RepID=A0A4C1U073_EUMVA|nr:hypothetical protein EVAR_15802_1 [Eumeta japonica]
MLHFSPRPPQRDAADKNISGTFTGRIQASTSGVVSFLKRFSFEDPLIPFDDESKVYLDPIDPTKQVYLIARYAQPGKIVYIDRFMLDPTCAVSELVKSEHPETATTSIRSVKTTNRYAPIHLK